MNVHKSHLDSSSFIFDRYKLCSKWKLIQGNAYPNMPVCVIP